MLYTSYLANLKNIPGDFINILITRFPPKHMEFKKTKLKYIYKSVNHKKLWLILNFSPNKDILLQYKKDNDWQTYKRKFVKQIQEDKLCQKYIKSIYCDLIYNPNKNYCFICYEKNNMYCHRKILSDLFKKNNIKVKEI